MLYELTGTRALTALMIAFAMGCGQSTSAVEPTTPPTPTPPTTPPPPQSSPGLIRGIALDTQGRPMAGVKIWVRPALTTGLLTATTDANGRYQVQAASNLPYYAYAWHTVAYRGKNVCLRLASESDAGYESFVPTEGVTRNFKWKLSGEIGNATGSFFGGELRRFAPPTPAGSKLMITLTPDGPLVDGSAGQTITLDGSEVIFAGIPVGVYQVSAAFVAADGTRTPLETSPDGSTNYGAQAQVQWQSQSSCVGSTGSGPDRAFVWIRVPGSE